MKNINFFLISFFSIIFVSQSASVSSQNLPKWGLVFGSDTTIEDAKHEINYFNSKKIDQEVISYKNKAVIFLRDGKFREVLLFNTEQEAKNARKVVEPYLNKKDKIRKISLPNGRGSYPVNLGRFCPDWFIKKPMKNKYPGIPYFECSSQPSY